MSGSRTPVATGVALGAVALAHAALTWPPAATAAFFGGGALLALLAEAAAVARGWLEHHVAPKLVGVPVYLLLAWPGTVYVGFRVVRLATDGPTAVAVTAALLTGYDLLTDHRGVAAGHWTYTGGLPGPRYRGVPWWNFAGWFAVSAATAALALPFL